MSFSAPLISRLIFGSYLLFQPSNVLDLISNDSDVMYIYKYVNAFCLFRSLTPNFLFSLLRYYMVCGISYNNIIQAEDPETRKDFFRLFSPLHKWGLSLTFFF